MVADGSAVRGEQADLASHITLAGAPAFRDLGGHRVGAGGRTRYGRVYRSCALCETSREDRLVIRELGLATVLDLRDGAEAREEPATWLADSGVDVVHKPLVDVLVVPDGTDAGEMPNENPLVPRYLAFLESGAANLVAILNVIGDPERHPVLFHCTAGKDRTGVVAAILLDVLGAGRAEIGREYANHGRSGAWLRPFLERRPIQGPRVARMDPTLLEAAPETIIRLLEIITDRYSGSREFLLRHGADEQLFSRLDSSLVERD